MAKDLLTAKEVQEQFGHSRSSLLRYESGDNPVLVPLKPPGGQRRYLRSDIENLARREEAAVTKQPPARAALPNDAAHRPSYRELGTSGLTRFGGDVIEDELRELRGRAGRKTFTQMRKNDPVISATFLAW